MPLLNLLNRPIVLVDLFMINMAPTIFYFRFIFPVYSTLFFKLILIIFSPGLCSWRYHRWCLAGTQPLVCSVYCFLSCNFYVVIKKKKKVIIEHPKTSCKLSKTIRQIEKVSKVGSGKISNGSLYSHTKK